MAPVHDKNKQASNHSARNRCPACDAQVVAEGVAIPDHEYGLTYVARFVECGGCGTLFQSPMPTSEELASFYPSDYHSMTHAGLLSRVRNGMRIHRLAKIASKDGAILDYGCGDGAFLMQAAHEMPHHQFWGFEIAECPETRILSGGAVTIVKGGLPDLLAVLPSCSLITMNHVIEHLPDPLAVVTALVGRLRPGGIFEGQTPSADSLERAVFGERWSGYHAPRHTVVFSRRGLCRMLERCGFSKATVHGALNPAGLAVSLGSITHNGGGRTRRSGLKWLCLVGIGALLSPIDLWSGSPGIVDFIAYQRAG